MNQVLFDNLAGKVIKTSVLTRDCVAMVFEDDTFAIVQFCGLSTDSTEKVNLDPGYRHLNHAAVLAGIVSQADRDAAIAAVEHRRSEITRLEKELKALEQ